MLLNRLCLHFAAVIACAGFLAAPVGAQDYPDKAVKIVVPFAAGGPTDVVARVIADGLSEELKQPFVVENRRAPAARSAPILSRRQSPTATRSASPAPDRSRSFRSWIQSCPTIPAET